ncbi:hypothetical protein AB6A23_08570 [Paenibacillus tarimensis]
MKQVIRMIIVLMAIVILPTEVLAYSYGDPNEEAVAETFKAIVAEVEKPSIDWKKVEEVYKVSRSEIASHFGDSIAVTLDRNIESKDKAKLMANYKAVLVMNLKRRFDYAKKDIDDYSKSKLLLAKARGTYAVLDSYVEAEKPGASSGIYASFDAALEALGNPGLFGVGQKEVDAEAFGKQVDSIYKTVNPLFKYEAAPAPAKTEPAQQEQPKQEQTEQQTEPKTSAAAEKQPESSVSKTTNNSASGNSGTAAEQVKPRAAAPSESIVDTKSADSADVKPESGQTAEKEEAAGEAVRNEEAAPVQEAEAEAAVEADPQAADAASATGNETASGESEAAESGEVSEPAETSETEVSMDQLGETTSSPVIAAEHAPMERTKKTNAGVSIAVIAFVALLAGGTFWFAKKKKLL